MAIIAAKELEKQLQESGERLKQVREAAEKERERLREAEPQPIASAQTPLAARR